MQRPKHHDDSRCFLLDTSYDSFLLSDGGEKPKRLEEDERQEMVGRAQIKRQKWYVRHEYHRL